MLFLILFLLLVFFLIVEKILHERRLERIPVRIHVNGTRGKSSVTRLVSALLRENGIRTLAKTTGTLPRLIYPDGREEILPRRGTTRIQEQIRLIQKAAQMKVQAVVVECMAIDPQLQEASETRMVRSTLGVITNVRPDHFEVMGGNLDDIASALSRTIPREGILVTGDHSYFNFFARLGAEKKSKVILTRALDLPQGPSPAPLFIFQDNLAIAAEVCVHLGIHPSFPPGFGMDRLAGESSCRICRIKKDDRTLHFVDAFSANDIVSTQHILQMSLVPCPRPYIALLNNRADRPLRMVSFATFLAEETIYDYILLVGDLRRMARKHIRKGPHQKEILVLGETNPERLLARIFQKVPFAEFTVIGIGNDKGMGEKFSRFLLDREEK
jgi:poly-gamma-glutamate synthase PgsB/CapB